MKRYLLFFLLFSFTVQIFAQWDPEPLVAQEPEIDLVHEVNVDMGAYLTTTNPGHTLVGRSYALSTARFFSPRMGFRSGLTLVKMQEASQLQLMVPLYFCIRSLKAAERPPIFFNGSFSDLWESIFVHLLMPQLIELDMGTNLGYGISKINNSTAYSYDDGRSVRYGYQFDRNFIATLDGGVRLKYKIYRFGIVVSPMASYMVTQNYIFKSDASTDQFNNKRASWFFRGTVGVSYSF